MPLYGREGAIRLAGILIKRRPSPVLVFVGPPGSGKTVLLDELAGQLDQRLPYAHVDFADLPSDATTWDVLDVLVAELNWRCAEYGRLDFSRYLVGRMVIDAVAGDVDPARVRAQIETVLEEFRNLDRTKRFLEDLVAGVLRARDLPPEFAPLSVRLLLDGLTKGRWVGRRVMLGPGQEWYGHRDRGLQNDPLDVLARLSRRAQALEIGNNLSYVEGQLLAAFLADLSHDFEGKKHEYNCVVFLDDTDGAAGSGFVRKLVRAREQYANDVPDGVDPMTVITVSRGPLIESVVDPEQSLPAADEAAGDDRLLGRGLAHPDTARWWAPVWLPDLSQADVRTMVEDKELGEADGEHVTLILHGLTHGHPGATDLLLRAVAAHPKDRPVDPRRILGHRLPDMSSEIRVREQLYRDLLGPLRRRSTVEDDLITCSAARDLNWAAELATHSGLLKDGNADTVTRAELWIPGPTSGSLVLLPVLRRLLLERLAERAPASPNGWADVHTWLRRRAEEEGDVTGELYHALALGDHRYVTQELAARLRDTDVQTWLTLLDAVVRAPRGLQPPLDHPMDEAESLAEWADPDDRPVGPMALLVAARWVVADPYTSSERADLHKAIEKSYTGIAPYAKRGGRRTLIREAGRHQMEAGRWD